MKTSDTILELERQYKMMKNLPHIKHPIELDINGYHFIESEKADGTFKIKN